ncbi:ABC transporter substrate-binding protein [Streptomyces sp. NPDC049099]|uniref:ABC transporter substrate-binding protein n=1 Tax=Streptomyces sp. NPDC049099 TaxID=3155768 RepID=UPI00342A8FA4
MNASGGVDGKMLEAKEYDDGCDPRQAVAVANKVVNDGVRFVVGHMTSDTTQPVSDIYEDEGVIMITPAATGPDITARGYQLIFRTVGSTARSLLRSRADCPRNQGGWLGGHRQGRQGDPQRHLQDADRFPVLRREGRSEEQV